MAWRLKHQVFIHEWQGKIHALRWRSIGEYWNQDRFEMEVMQLMENKDMREVFLYAKNYIARYRVGRVRALMKDLYEEIIQYGVVEPGKLYTALKLIRQWQRGKP